MEFRNREEVAIYVQAELDSLPALWHVHPKYRFGRSHIPSSEATIADLIWKIFVASDEFADYQVHVSGDLRTFTVLFGNGCPGVWRPECAVYRSLTIFAESLDQWPLRNILTRMIDDPNSYPLNRWNLT